jgi:hypothetical protein
MPELYVTRRVHYQEQLDRLCREAAEVEESLHGVKSANDVPAARREELLARIAHLHDAFLQLSTDNRELISQQEYKLLEDRQETMAHWLAVLEGRSRL